jgi:hypothetical protein
MKVTVIATYVELARGTILGGLTEEQVRRHRIALQERETGKGEYEVIAPTHFKAGESFEMKEVPKSLREFVSVEGEHKPVAGKGLPADLDDMKRDELVELAEARGLEVKANATKADIIADLRKHAKKAA